jgi:hypothetical protein
MEFIMKGEHTNILEMVISDEFIIWLLFQLEDMSFLNLDPYRNITLHRHEQEQLLRASQSIMTRIHKQIFEQLRNGSKLPSDRNIQEFMLMNILVHRKQENKHFAILEELIALLEISLEGGYTIFCRGD